MQVDPVQLNALALDALALLATYALHSTSVQWPGGFRRVEPDRRERAGD